MQPRTPNPHRKAAIANAIEIFMFPVGRLLAVAPPPQLFGLPRWLAPFLAPRAWYRLVIFPRPTSQSAVVPASLAWNPGPFLASNPLAALSSLMARARFTTPRLQKPSLPPSTCPYSARTPRRPL